MRELREREFFGPHDPLFAKTRVGRGPEGGFAALGLDRAPWASASSLVEIFKSAVVGAGLPPHPPHRIRDTLAEMARDFCRSPEDYKTWSQNLGHSDVLTTLTSYGSVAPGRQVEVMAGFRRRHCPKHTTDDPLAEPVLACAPVRNDTHADALGRQPVPVMRQIFDDVDIDA